MAKQWKDTHHDRNLFFDQAHAELSVLPEYQGKANRDALLERIQELWSQLIKTPGPSFTVQFKVGWRQRTNDETDEPDPTPEELEQYIASSSVIPQNITYLDELNITEPAQYIGDRTFQFTCTAHDAYSIWDAIMNQSMADGEWESMPGKGSFVYPCLADEGEMPEELGLLDYESVTINGKTYTRTQKPKRKPVLKKPVAKPALAEPPTEPPAVIPFYSATGKYGAFSNFAKTPFQWDGVQFGCSEQAIMYCKAVLFGDTETGQKILETTSPAQIKALGRKVRGYDEKQWKAERERAAPLILYAKFSSTEKLRNLLLSTGSAVIVEASPDDKIWGVGMAASHANIHKPETWPKGSNLLGRALMRAREMLAED